MLFTVPLLTTIQQCVALVYWRSLSETGDQNVFLLLVMLALAGICTSLLLAILVLIAKGWQITRPTMLDSEWRNVGGASAPPRLSGWPQSVRQRAHESPALLPRA